MNRFIAALLTGLVVLCAGPVRSEIIDKIIAIVNDEIITLKEVERYVHVEKQGRFSSVNEYLRDMQLRDKLDAIIENMLIKQQAKKFKIEISDKEVEGMIDGIKKRHLITESELREQLKREGIEYEDFKEGMRMNLVRSRVIARSVSSEVLVTDRDLLNYYNSNPEEFREEEYHLEHIFISGQRQDSAQRAAKVYDELKAGKPFRQAAQEYSDEPTGRQGGDIGYAKKEDLFPELKNGVALLIPGSYSHVIRTPYGFHILKLIDVKKAEMVPFESVKDRIHQQIVQRESEKRYKEWMQKLRSSSYIEVKI